tara:strand:+ start:215 stop:496 length:282 start_codon:yes stop_codon:yes gene_type:complete
MEEVKPPDVKKMCPFHKWKDILGVPKKGVHKSRFLDTAIIDLLLTFILASLITRFTKIPLVLTIIGTLVLGIILHILFGVPTNTTKYLGFSCK